MKKNILLSLILLMGVVSALSFSNVAGVKEQPVRLAENHVAMELSAFDKEGKKIVLDYSEHYGLTMTQELLAGALIEQKFWDMNSVEAVEYVAGQKTIADDKVIELEGIISKF